MTVEELIARGKPFKVEILKPHPWAGLRGQCLPGSMKIMSELTLYYVESEEASFYAAPQELRAL